MTTTTPNMNLVLPDVLMTVGPTWASLLNAAYNVIDSHDHSTGEGVAITPAGINISSDLSFASNNATNLRTARLYNNSAITLGVNDRTCLYALNNELYYEDGAGNNVQVTANGALNLAGGVTSLTLNDSAFILQYFGDTSRKFRFSAASIPASTTRIFTLPDNGTGNSTLVSIDATQTLTNKTLGSTNTATGILIASLTSDGSHTLTFPTSTDTLVGKATVDTLTNKIISGNTAATLKPDGVAVLTLPVATDTLVGKATTDDLTNKSFNGATVVKAANELRFNNSGNTFYTGIKGGAAASSGTFILPITDGTASQVLSTDGSRQLGWSTAATTVGNVAANDSAVVFTNADNRTQICLPTVARSYTLPTTSIVAGDTWNFYNQSAFLITILASGGTTEGYVYPFSSTTCVALQNTPTTNAHWNHYYHTASEWTAYTPTVSAGAGTVSSNSAFYRIVGDNLFVRGSFTTGTITAAKVSISLPSGLTLSSAKLSLTNDTSNPGNLVGAIGQNIAGESLFLLTAPTTSTTGVYLAGSIGGTAAITPTGSALTSTTITSYSFEVPLV